MTQTPPAATADAALNPTDRNMAAMQVLQAFVMAQKSQAITRRMAIEAYIGADVLVEVSLLTPAQLKAARSAVALDAPAAP